MSYWLHNTPTLPDDGPVMDNCDYEPADMEDYYASLASGQPARPIGVDAAMRLHED